MPSGVYKRKPISAKHRANLAAAHTGLHHSEETKNKLSQANIKTWKKKKEQGLV